jgi:predicted ATP-binding protein involved in virulence
MSDNIKFLKIDHETNDILLNTDKGTIVLEQLSSGFLSYILVLLGLIKDIEYRFKKPHIKVTDFEGILIIDEVDVHMHPSLQANMYYELKRILPKAQIFTSTHSPHVVQVAAPEEIISLVRDTEGGIVVNPKRSKEYGFKGWTIEEILTDVMGMTCTNSKTFSDLILEFNDAVKKEDQKKAADIYEKIDKMLHPDNILRQVLKLQLE